MNKVKVIEDTKTNIIRSTKNLIQASLLTVAYSVGYGIGAANRTINSLVIENNLSFVKELMLEAEKGYEDAFEKEDSVSNRYESAAI